MTRKMTVGAAAAAFFGTILAASATSVAGVAWTSETTNVWFDAEIANIATGTAKEVLSGLWDVPDPANGEAWATNRTVVFDTEVSNPLTYNPADSGPVALVNVQMVVDPNAAMPSTNDLGLAQAALSVVTNDTNGGLEWIGLTTTNSVLAWVKLSGNTPTLGATYDVQIAVDNHASKRIRYAVKPAAESTYVVLTCDVAQEGGWLPNPQPAKSSVDKVAFAGAGTIKSLVGKNVEDASVVVDSFSDSATGGYDFTNGTITAVVTIPSGVDGKKANMVVKNTSGVIVTNITGQAISSASAASVPFNVSGLTAGASYTYELSIDYGNGDVRTVKSGTFVAAIWDDGCLFGGKVEDGVTNVVNGVMSGAVVGTDKWNVDANAQFMVADTSLGANKVTRVDTSYLFESFIDTDSLDSLQNAVGGIVAVSNGADPAWYAYTGTGEFNGWQKLKGDIVPATNTDYVIRAEFDFKSTPKRVSYAVSTNAGSTFSSLALLNGDVMIALVGENPPNTLSSVEMSGKGSVRSICANLADASVAEVGGVKYDSLWQAVKAANGDGTVTLLTNATLKPSGITSGKYPFTVTGGFSFILDKSEVPGAWKVVKKGGVWYLMKPAATYIFF